MPTWSRLLFLLLLSTIAAYFWKQQREQSPPHDEPLALVENGIPKVVIVVSPESPKPVRDAAAFLARTLGKSFGTAPQLVADAQGRPAIHIGQTDYVRQHPADTIGLDEEGFLLEGRPGGQFIIAGGGPWGTEYGVYEFLERYLGVRWLMPGRAGEVIPSHTTLSIPTEPVRQSPVYNLARTFSGGVTKTDEVEWTRLNRIRFGRLNRAHNLNRLFPPSRFAKEHPEFYPMLGGRRFIPPNDANYQWQPNFSEPGLVDAAVEEIDRHFREKPEETSFSLATNDTALFDESPASLARRTGKRNTLGFLDVSNDYFPWANAVVAGVLRRHPDKWFGTQGYRETLNPPDTPVHERLVPHITYERLKWSDPALRAGDQELTRRWAAMAPTLGWYDYLFGVSYLVPRTWPHLMQEYLAWGAGQGVRSYHGDYLPNWSGEGPKPWILAKLLWNPNQDVDALLDDWYRNAVGPAAAPKLREHYAQWEKFWTETIRQSEWYLQEGGDGALYMRFSEPAYLSAIPPELLQRSDELLDEVCALASTPDEKTRAERLRRMWRFYHASAATWQAEWQGMTTPPTTEAEALARLEAAAPVLALNHERMRLLNQFTIEDGPFIPHFYSRPLLVGAYWGRSLFWGVRPWVARSEAVRARLRVLAANPKTPEGALAGQLLRVEAGQAPSLLRDPGFAEGFSHWAQRLHRTSGGTFRIVPGAGAEGGNVIEAEGVARGSVSQTFDSTPGEYLLGVRAKLLSATGNARVQFRFIPSGMAWRDSGYFRLGRTLPARVLPLRQGEWVSFELPFELPKGATPDKMEVQLDITGLAEGEKVQLEGISLSRIAPLP